ncbi:MAG: polyphosphate kinase 1 [Ruminococcaceae bacterium]|nr:polyphosphate kinase 1 [Oscillospiraceae bacterium]
MTREMTLPADDRPCFTDRELSWLQFDRRVLMESADRGVPLLERLKFLNIYYKNLDEFFMVRVGSLSHRSLLLPYYEDPKTGWTANTQLKRILQEVSRQQKEAESVWLSLREDLAESGIDVLDFDALGGPEEAICRKLFAELRPMLSPRILDRGQELPFLAGGENCIAVLLGKGEGTTLGLVSLFRLPPYRVFELDGREKVVITAELVRHYAAQLFKKQNLRESCVIRLTRNADVFIEDDLRSLAEDFRASMERMLRKRKRQQPVRLQIAPRASGRMVETLAKELRLSEKSIFISAVPFDLGFGAELRRHTALLFPEQRPQRTIQLRKGEFFPYLAERDILLSFPWQSMQPFITLLYEAADDPAVESISITLYRLAASSKVAAALAYAADRGKDVLCLLELRARFDEQNNIDYSEVLEGAGCRVIYGLPYKKVHSKLCLITRTVEGDRQYITQIGTGNYNEITGEHYCDLSLITSDRAIGEDAAAVFAALEKGETPPDTKKLWVAPRCYKTRLLELLETERQKGEQGFVALKANSINDLDVMRKLMDCARAGVPVELFIRGICCLRPGIPGFTENIRVKSVVGRWLEHSRIFVFGRGEAQRIFMGSGDLLNRNTRRRVEAFAEVERPEIREQLLEIMEAYRQDGEKGWEMQPDGSYRKADSDGADSQERLRRYFTAQLVESPPQPEPQPEAKPVSEAESMEDVPPARSEKRGLLRRFFRWLFGKK